MYLVNAAKAEVLDVGEFCRLVSGIVAFQPDPQQAEKDARRKEAPANFLTRLQPMPRFDACEYEQILGKGVRPLAEKFPLPIVITLVEAMRHFEHLKNPSPEMWNGVRSDGSEVWCVQLNERSGLHMDPDETLVPTLCFAFERVFARENRRTAKVEEPDWALRAERWLVLDRLRYHLYGE